MIGWIRMSKPFDNNNTFCGMMTIPRECFIENEILDKHSIMIPVSSSHTQNGETEVGRPTVDTPTESGEASREQQ